MSEHPLAGVFRTLDYELTAGEGWERIVFVGDDALATLFVGGRVAALVLLDPGPPERLQALVERWLERLGSKPLEKVSHLVLVPVLVDTPDPETAAALKRVGGKASARRRVTCSPVDLERGRHAVGWGFFVRGLRRAWQRTLRRRRGGKLFSQEAFERAMDQESRRCKRLYDAMASCRCLGTKVLVGLCLAVFLGETALGGSQSQSVLLRLGANFGPLSLRGQWWRLYGSAFLHIGVVHILLNMVSLWIVGLVMEPYYGTEKFLALYGFSALCGSLASGWFHMVVSAGASGAIFGLCGAFVWIAYRHGDQLPASTRRRILYGLAPVVLYSLVFDNLAFGLVDTHIDTACHVGGLLAGSLFAMLTVPSIFPGKDRLPRFAVLLLAFSTFVGLGVSLGYGATHPTMASYPRRIEHSPSGYSFAYPLGLVPSQGTLVGPGLRVLSGVLQPTAPAAAPKGPVPEPALIPPVTPSSKAITLQGTAGGQPSMVTIVPSGSRWVLIQVVYAPDMKRDARAILAQARASLTMQKR